MDRDPRLGPHAQRGAPDHTWTRTESSNLLWESGAARCLQGSNAAATDSAGTLANTNLSGPATLVLTFQRLCNVSFLLSSFDPCLSSAFTRKSILLGKNEVSEDKSKNSMILSVETCLNPPGARPATVDSRRWVCAATNYFPSQGRFTTSRMEEYLFPFRRGLQLPESFLLSRVIKTAPLFGSGAQQQTRVAMTSNCFVYKRQVLPNQCCRATLLGFTAVDSYVYQSHGHWTM